ncbi:MAG: enoyl-CoA hydratase/isomerase family protein [candidate division Zixibacteria bacterium]|nr:enoyl-CoA hydratase/isomerase family protein [candidate division Zixibacteria bacterium]
MSFVREQHHAGIATLTLSRGKVNALNEPMVEEIRQSFENMGKNPDVKAVILTGEGKFFSFGFDIPEFLGFQRESFARYLKKFTDLLTYLFVFPKPVVAALNGHAVAGGCMLATTCDYRLMVSGKAKISLNEVSFGSSVFAGSVDILKFCTGAKNASEILLSGTMYSAEEALRLNLIDQISSLDRLQEDAEAATRVMAGRAQPAFASLKRLLRQPLADTWANREAASIEEFLDIWYSEDTWKQLQDIKIHS